jgi:hypothetical protein
MLSPDDNGARCARDLKSIKRHDSLASILGRRGLKINLTTEAALSCDPPLARDNEDSNT